MTTSTLYGQPGTGNPTLTADPTAYTLGVQFAVTQACAQNGVWFYSPAGAANLPQTIATWQATGVGTGTLLRSEPAVWSGAAGSGWVRAAFTQPPVLSSANKYKTGVLQTVAANWYGSIANYFSSGPGGSGIASGLLTAPNGAGSFDGQNTFFASGLLTYPNQQFNSSYYTVDPEVSTSYYNTGTTVSVSFSPNSSGHPTLTIPAGVLTGDVMVLSVNCFTFQGGTPSFSAPVSGGGSWSQIGTIATSGQGGSGLTIYSTCWYKVATSSDPGSVLSITYTGTPGTTDQVFWDLDFESYTGFYTGSPVGAVAQATGTATGVATLACATAQTVAPGSWALYFCPSTVAGSGSILSGPAGNASRRLFNPGNGVDNAVSDSSRSVGAAGTTIGGGNFTFSSSPDWASAFTVELRTPPAVAPGSSLLMAQFPL